MLGSACLPPPQVWHTCRALDGWQAAELLWGVQMLAETLDKAVRPSDRYYNTLIRILATRCMTQASYLPLSCEHDTSGLRPS